MCHVLGLLKVSDGFWCKVNSGWRLNGGWRLNNSVLF